MNVLETARQQAAQAVLAAYQKAAAAGVLPEAALPAVAVEIPKDASNGDFASTFAMQCAKPLRMAPRKIAEAIVANLSLEDTCFEKIEIQRMNVNFIERCILGNQTTADHHKTEKDLNVQGVALNSQIRFSFCRDQIV